VREKRGKVPKKEEDFMKKEDAEKAKTQAA